MADFHSIFARIKERRTPLTLAVIAQASNIAIWVTKEGQTGYTLINVLIAFIAAFSIDLIIVSTAFIEKRSQLAWILALATSIIALVFSAAIAVYVFNPNPEQITVWSGLHISFPVLVFFYSWFLSITENDDRKFCEQEAQMQQEIEQARIPANIMTYRQALIYRLVERGFNLSAIYDIVGGNKQATLQLIKTIQIELGIEVEPTETE